MPVTIKKSQLLYKDTSTGNYVSVDAVADKTSEQQINGIQIAANNAIGAINDALDDISTEPLIDLPKKAYKNDLTTNTESLGSSASKPYSVGDYFYVSDNENDRSLYKVTADIASGGTISPGTAASNNCIPAALAEDVNALSNDLLNLNDALSEIFASPIVFTNVTNSAMWTFGQEIVPETGSNYAINTACRSTYISFNRPISISLDNSDYIFIAWVYSERSVNGALYSPTEAYENKDIVLIPKASNSYFRIGVKRVDDAVLTTDFTDQTSDAYKIINSLHTFTITSDTLDNDYVPINSKAIKDNALLFKGLLADQTDLNTLLDPGIYVLITSRTYSNSPITSGFLCVYKIETVFAQMAYSFGTVRSFIPTMFIRCTAVSAEITSAWRMLGKYRKTYIKMACFGDSIMYGQNGDTSSRESEENRIPSILAYNLNIETTNYGVGSQGYIGLISEKAYDNISTKNLSDFNAMLMCYGVNDGYSNLGTWDSTDESTIMGQFNKIINYVFEQNPSIRLIVVAPYNGKNVGTFPKYWYGERSHPQGYVSRQTLSDTLKQACEYYNIPYIEQKTSPINGYTIETLIGADGVHPSTAGYLQLGAWLSGEVGKLIG